jgi:hypothetical protein
MADRLDRVDLPELLEAVVRALREEGAEAEADHLDSVSTCAYTTSSEYLGQVGLALRVVRDSVERRASPSTISALEEALDMVREVWPDLG